MKMTKRVALLLLPFLANGAIIPLDKRQGAGELLGTLVSSGSNLAALLMPKQKAYKIEQIQPQTGIPGAKRVRIIYGPYRLRAANSTAKVGNSASMDPGGTGYSNMVADDFPRDITVLEAQSEIQNPDFTRAKTDQGIYNHHNVFMDLVNPGVVYGCEEAATPSLGSNPPFSVFAAGATEEGKVRFFAEDGKVKAGYYLKKDLKMLNMIDVINYNKEEKTVFTSTELEYLDGKPEGYLQSTQHRVDPGICGGPSGTSIHPPKGQSRFSVKSSNIEAKKNGWIVNARGHMHDGGIDIVFKINDKVVCDSKAVYGGDGHIAKGADGKVWETIRESSYCPNTIEVKKGDKIFMQANYDVELHPSREMGGMSGMHMRNVAGFLDGGHDAEQMALMVTYFASAE